MNTNSKRYVIATTLLAAASTGAVFAATSSSGAPLTPAGPASHTTSTSWTPDDCIRLNGGDFNACNVGNSGRGNLPYATNVG